MARSIARRARTCDLTWVTRHSPLGARSRPAPLLLALAIALAIAASLVALTPSSRADEPPAEVTAPEIPPENAANLRRAPRRPEFDEADQARARALLSAILADDPELGKVAYLPRDIFRAIKAIADPDRLYDRLMIAFARDIHALHEEVPAGAEFVRLDFTRWRSWIEVREEGNRYPYWSARRNRFVYQVPSEDGTPGRERSFELRTLITWGDAWYITHVREFGR